MGVTPEQAFTDAMSDLIDACADLAELEGRESTETIGGVPVSRGAGSWEQATAYNQVLARFHDARAAHARIPGSG